ncbi:MAG: RDD family protein [Chloroflexota bacterium]|nr:RDD family protein [Chloroflexota bacterium]
MNEPGPQLASQGRRLAGAVLDVGIFLLTLGIGWVIWYLIAVRRGQSPAKRLLGMRVIREDGAPATLGWSRLPVVADQGGSS